MKQSKAAARETETTIMLDTNPRPQLKSIGGGQDDRWNNRIANRVLNCRSTALVNVATTSRRVGLLLETFRPSSHSRPAKLACRAACGICVNSQNACASPWSLDARSSPCSAASALQLSAEFSECSMRKATGLLKGDAAILKQRLAVPIARVFLDDPRRFAAMKVQSSVKIAVLTDRGKPFVRADMFG
jgi:hypothetical protein